MMKTNDELREIMNNPIFWAAKQREYGIIVNHCNSASAEGFNFLRYSEEVQALKKKFGVK
jgi:hypothetical protein